MTQIFTFKHTNLEFRIYKCNIVKHHNSEKILAYLRVEAIVLKTRRQQTPDCPLLQTEDGWCQLMGPGHSASRPGQYQ